MIPYSNSLNPEYIIPFKNKDLIPLICQGCQTQFLKPKFRIIAAIKYGKTLYCTAKCYNESIKRERIKTNCTNCGEELAITDSDWKKSKTLKFFCNHSCAATYSNKTRKSDRTRKYVACKWCQKPTNGHLCCSPHCGQKYYQAQQWEEYKEKIKNNDGFDKENRRMTRKYLIDEYGHKCTICNIFEWQGHPVPLVCDHIDGNSENNQLDNLRMVCQNCNALLPTFAGKNKGKGRKAKREQYHKDKSCHLD